jgi:hypothetical protein
MNTQATISRRANELPASGQTYDETAHAAKSPQILVVSNGSQPNGGEPATVGELLELLKEHPLDPMFEDYGNFANDCPISYKTDKPLLPAGWWSFWGNFQTISHVFKIVTNDAQAIQDLRQAILANQASPGYKQAREAIQKRTKLFAAGRSLPASKS